MSWRPYWGVCLELVGMETAGRAGESWWEGPGLETGGQDSGCSSNRGWVWISLWASGRSGWRSWQLSCQAPWWWDQSPGPLCVQKHVGCCVSSHQGICHVAGRWVFGPCPGSWRQSGVCHGHYGWDPGRSVCLLSEGSLWPAFPAHSLIQKVSRHFSQHLWLEML